MAHSEENVRPITRHEVGRAADVLANAFADDPLFGFILDGRNDIEARLGHLFRDAAAAELRKSGHLVEREGIPTYLESTNPTNDAWYARFGFESRGPVPLPSGAPVLTAMWRDVR